MLQFINSININLKYVLLHHHNEAIPIGNKTCDKLAHCEILLLARIRASVIYYHANAMNYLVVGTDDKSEYLIGYFTKYGDGASDILPIKNLYKTEVQKLGSYLKIPDKIVKKIPGPHLWKDHDSKTELGIEYTTIDTILIIIWVKI